MSKLDMDFFGATRVTLDGRPVHFATDKAQALLSYLTVEADRPHRREILGSLLWPDKPEDAARANLRQTLYRLRVAIGDLSNPDPHLLISAREIQLNPASDHRSDVADFEGNLTLYKAHCGRDLPLCVHCREALKAIVAIYEGDFMAGFSVSDSPTFELWLLTKQEYYRRQVLGCLGRLGAFYERQRDFGRAVDCARQMVDLEPWRESSHRLLMRTLAQAGRDRAALAQYESCRQLLAEEMGVEPSAATRRIVEAIRAGDMAGWSNDRLRDRSNIEITRPPEPPRIDDVSRLPLPFIGRVDELAKLDAYLDRALAGHGQVAFIKGEAGSGKTTLATEFCRQAAATEEALLVTYGGCDAQNGLGDLYQPFREALCMLIGRGGTDPAWLFAGEWPALRLQSANPAIRQALAEAGSDLPGTLLPAINNLNKGPSRSDRSNLVQTALFEQVTGFLLALARNWPLILFLDDLHWTDEASASLLFHLGRHLANSRILVLGAYRPEEVDWGERANAASGRHPLLATFNGLRRLYGDIQIDLDQVDGRAFVEAFIDSEPNRLGRNFRDNLYKQTLGNPLFTVEILRGLQDRAELTRDEEGRWMIGKELDWERLPARVEAVIAERFDRLPDDCQSIMVTASVQGQTFLAEVVADVLPEKAGSVIRSLSDILGQQHHIVTAVSREHYGDHAVSRYRFRHHLFQQFAYHQLDLVAQSRLHEATGLALEKLYAGKAGEHAFELARHFSSAGLVAKAVDYLLQSGKEAYRLSDVTTAIDCFRRGLALLRDTPAGLGRDHAELALQLALTAPLLASHGYAASAVKKAASRAIELAQWLGEPDYLISARLMLLYHLVMRAEYQPAIDLAMQLLKQAEEGQNPLHLAQANHALGFIEFCVGSFHEALYHFDSAITSFEPQVDSPLLPRYIGHNTWLTTLIRKAWLLWFLGFPDKSLAVLKKSMSEIEGLDQDHDLAFTLGLGICPIFYIRGEFKQAEAQAIRLLELIDRKDLQYFVPFGQFFLGTGMVRRGRRAEGLNELRTGIRRYRDGGQRVLLSFCLATLAENLGDDEEAGTILDEATDLVEETGERFFEAEISRLRGEYLWQRGANPIQVESCYRQALDIAHRQQAKSLELRAATSLARFWQRQDRLPEARSLLSYEFGWFTEGFETLDLQEAQSLLAKLNGYC